MPGRASTLSPRISHARVNLRRTNPSRCFCSSVAGSTGRIFSAVSVATASRSTSSGSRPASSAFSASSWVAASCAAFTFAATNRSNSGLSSSAISAGWYSISSAGGFSLIPGSASGSARRATAAVAPGTENAASSAVICCHPGNTCSQFSSSSGFAARIAAPSRSSNSSPRTPCQPPSLATLRSRLSTADLVGLGPSTRRMSAVCIPRTAAPVRSENISVM